MMRAAFLIALAPIVAKADETDINAAFDLIETHLEAVVQGDYAAIEVMRPPDQLHRLIETKGVSRDAYLEQRAAKIERWLKMVTLEHVGILPYTLATNQTSTGRIYVEATVETFWRTDPTNLRRMRAPVIAF